MNTALLLIALGFGYKIFAEASVNAKKSLKQLGRLVGITIMVVSFTGTLCVLWRVVEYGKGGYYCPMGFFGKGGTGSKAICPLTGKPLENPARPANP